MRDPTKPRSSVNSGVPFPAHSPCSASCRWPQEVDGSGLLSLNHRELFLFCKKSHCCTMRPWEARLGGPETAVWSLTFQKHGDIFELRHVVLPVATVLGQQREVFQILPASVSGIELGELSEHDAPCLRLFLCVLHPGNGLAATQERGPVNDASSGTEFSVFSCHTYR